jgi:ureidoacrylate peracid hydrolase
MQNAFMLPGVAHALCPRAVDIVPNVNRLATLTRQTGGTVAWIRMCLDDAAIHEWRPLVEMSPPEQTMRRRSALAPGSPGHQLWEGLDVHSGDLVFDKTRYSAFQAGSCALPALLRERMIDTVLITGTITNVCCDASARDAMQQNFRAVMITDANAALTDDEHNWAILNFRNAFGDAMSSDEAIALMRAGPAQSTRS